MSDAQIQEILALQKEMFRHQQESTKQILALQKEVVDVQERERAQRRNLFRASIIIFIAYLIFSVAPLFLMKY